MDSVKILVFAVSLILMLGGHEARKKSGRNIRSIVDDVASKTGVDKDTLSDIADLVGKSINNSQGLACKPCINYRVKSNTLPSQAATFVKGLHLDLLKDSTCNRIGECPQPSDREKVSKCALYEGDGTLILGTGQKVTGDLEFRKCEEMSAKKTNSCTSIRVEDFKNINFFNDFLSVLPEEASTTLKQISTHDITITFDGSRCLNVARSGASHFKKSDSRNASMFMVVLVLAMFDFEA